ncbi:MAG: START-like domain-containing protein [Bacteroidetes bacterium]|nr:START-like domain-containing protein [Bacteroidota bacterium]MDA0888353.1 START-like domain-containing protein [Bacteroidota bacterium]MDA1084670.1 START-like domain-containing protein [Bacteroidota bacterium]
MSKTKIELEFIIQASPQLLYQYMHTPSGLSEWFADNVNARTEKYSFFWDDSEEEALLLRKKANEFVRFRWLNGDDDQDDCYFEMRIVVDEITKDVSVVVTDFADEDEVDETKMLWESQIGDLKQVLGSA